MCILAEINFLNINITYILYIKRKIHFIHIQYNTHYTQFISKDAGNNIHSSRKEEDEQKKRQ